MEEEGYLAFLDKRQSCKRASVFFVDGSERDSFDARKQTMEMRRETFSLNLNSMYQI